MSQFDDVVNPDDLVPIAESQDYFLLSRKTVERWIRDGLIKSYKRVGDRRTYVSRSQVRVLTEFKEKGSGYSVD